MQRAGRERISHLSNRNKKWSIIYLHISVPTNLQYESRVLIIGNKNGYRTIWKIYFCRKATIDQLNVQTVTAEKEKWYNLSKVAHV